jgi:signal transduction histidine kinase
VPLDEGSKGVATGGLTGQEARILGLRIGRNGSVVAVRDLSTTPSLNTLQDRFGWLLAIPVRDGNRVSGVLMVLGPEPRPLVAKDVDALSDLGSMLLAATRGIRDTEDEQGNSADQDVLAAVIQDLPLLIQVLDENGVITRTEGRGRDWLELAPAEPTAITAWELYGEDESIRAALESALAGETSSFTSQIGKRSLEHRLIPLFDEVSGARSAVSIAMDVTRRATIENESRDAKERAEAARGEAEAAHREQSNFLASMSHEIRTPLTGIIGFADVLVEVAEGDARTYAELIQKSGHRLLETLNSVLNLARLDADQVPIRVAAVDLAEEARDAVRLLRPLAEQKDLSFNVEVESVNVATDPNLVHRVITNLVANAIKFTDEGSVSVHVTPEADGAVIDVVDTGRGMKPEFLPLLFEPFRREVDGHSRPDGTGLGLTITRRLVHLLGGSISVESEFGQGSRFSVHLPASAVDDPEPDADQVELVLEWRSVVEAEGDGATAGASGHPRAVESTA